MNVELLANLLLTGGVASYVIWYLRREKPGWTEINIFATVGTVDLLVRTRFRMVPGGAIPLGYACILVALWRSLQLVMRKEERSGGVAS
jgi:hypothetical protein